MTAFAVDDYVVPRGTFRRCGDPLPVDIAARRTTFGRVLEPLPSAPTVFTYAQWLPYVGTFSQQLTDLVYQVQVWDVDARALVTESYPESYLSLFTPDGNANAVGYDSNSPELSSLFAAARIG